MANASPKDYGDFLRETVRREAEDSPEAGEPSPSTDPSRNADDAAQQVAEPEPEVGLIGTRFQSVPVSLQGMRDYGPFLQDLRRRDVTAQSSGSAAGSDSGSGTAGRPRTLTPQRRQREAEE